MVLYTDIYLKFSIDDISMQELKIAFVSAPYRCFDKNRRGGKHPTNGIMILGGDILDKGLVDDVKIFDGAFFNSLDELTSAVRDYNPDIIGIPGYTDSMPETKTLFENMNNIPIKITGGPYSSARIEELLEYTDVVFIGEAENSLRSFMTLIHQDMQPSEMQLKEIKGIAFKTKEGEIIKTERSPVVHDLDSISFRGRELTVDYFPYYRIANYRHLSDNFTSIMGSRGCNSSCIYCCSNLMHGKGYRFRSVENLEEEIDFINRLRKYQGLPSLESIKFDDDDFFAREDNEFFKLCEMLASVGVTFTAFASVNASNENKIRIASECGMRSVFLGVESHEGQRSYIGRGSKGDFTDEEITQMLELCREHGIKTSAGYIIGFPQETIGDINMTIDAMIHIPVDYPTMNILTIHPGTYLWKWQQNHSELYPDIKDNPFTHVDRKKWPGDPDGLCSPHPELTKEDLSRLKTKAYQKAYTDPERIYRLMKTARTPQEAMKTFFAFNDYYSLAVKER